MWEQVGTILNFFVKTVMKSVIFQNSRGKLKFQGGQTWTNLKFFVKTITKSVIFQNPGGASAPPCPVLPLPLLSSIYPK